MRAPALPDEARAIRAYLAFMMGFIARGLAAASAVDPVAREELAPFPPGFTFEMGVLPDGPALRLRKGDDGALAPLAPGGPRPDLSIRWKHLRHAFATLTFAESAARSLADNRMIVDGDLASAMRMQRVLDRLLVLTLPAPIARRALKRLPAIRAPQKLADAARLYARMMRP